MSKIVNKKNRNVRKPRARRRREERTMTTVQNPSWTFMKQRMIVTLKYGQLDGVALAAGTGVQQIFNLNSIFDPDRTGAGHQPYGFDQLAALYNRYRVINARWKVNFSNSIVGAYLALVTPTNALLAAAVVNQATFQTAMEYPANVNHVRIVSAYGPSVTITGSLAESVLNGVLLREYMADDRFEAVVTASPAELILLYLAWYNPTLAALAVYYSIELEFDVDFHDPIALPTS